ncbi:MAG: thioredoxin domain-containing protein, partial [Clostridia bacterium]|nr:thioredoxin domain-containing protein [Clostridia bacterium]
WGLLELYEVTFEVEYLKTAVQAADQLLERFFDKESGGFYPYAADEEQLITRSQDTYDGAMPSGNAVAALVLSRLSRLTGEPRFQAAFDTQMRYLSGGIESYPIGHGFALMSLLESCWPTQELVVTATTMPEELPRFLRKAPRPNLTVLVKTPENADRLRAVAPFTEAYPIPESGARYYLCRDGACEAPVESMEALKVDSVRENAPV